MTKRIALTAGLVAAMAVIIAVLWLYPKPFAGAMLVILVTIAAWMLAGEILDED